MRERERERERGGELQVHDIVFYYHDMAFPTLNTLRSYFN